MPQNPLCNVCVVALQDLELGLALLRMQCWDVRIKCSNIRINLKLNLSQQGRCPASVI
ncbi:hypothetical protein MIDIC_510031 [Alphaproteobacteria bacterium]